MTAHEALISKALLNTLLILMLSLGLFMGFLLGLLTRFLRDFLRAKNKTPVLWYNPDMRTVFLDWVKRTSPTEFDYGKGQDAKKYILDGTSTVRISLSKWIGGMGAIIHPETGWNYSALPTPEELKDKTRQFLAVRNPQTYHVQTRENRIRQIFNWNDDTKKGVPTWVVVALGLVVVALLIGLVVFAATSGGGAPQGVPGSVQA